MVMPDVAILEEYFSRRARVTKKINEETEKIQKSVSQKKERFFEKLISIGDVNLAEREKLIIDLAVEFSVIMDEYESVLIQNIGLKERVADIKYCYKELKEIKK